MSDRDPALDDFPAIVEDDEDAALWAALAEMQNADPRELAAKYKLVRQREDDEDAEWAKAHPELYGP